MAAGTEEARSVFYKRCGTAEVASGNKFGRPGSVCDKRSIYAARRSGPVLRCSSCVCVCESQRTVVLGTLPELVTIEDSSRFAHGIQQSKRGAAARRCSRAYHRHQRHEAGSSCYQLDWLSLLGAPDNPTAERTSQFQTIANRELLGEVRGNFAIRQSFDRYFDTLFGVRRRGYGV